MNKYINDDKYDLEKDKAYLEKQKAIIELNNESELVSDPLTNSLVEKDVFELNNISNHSNIKKHSKAILFKIVIIVTLLIVVISAFIIGYRLVSNITYDENKYLSTNAFFIKENDKYALFNEKGKKLTNFNFSDVNQFYNNGALVYNEDGVSGIIDNRGHMIKDFGQYQYILNEGPLFYLTNLNGNSILLTGNNHVIKDDVGFEIIATDNNYLVIKEYNSYTIYNAYGKKVYSFNNTNNDELVPVFNYKDGYMTIFYNNIVYLLNFNKRKLILKFNSDDRFCINEISKNKDLIITKCNSLGDTINPYDYRLIKNNKIQYIKTSNEYISLNFVGSEVVLKNNSNHYILDKYGEILLTNNNIVLYDANNYAIKKDDNIIDIYVNGKLKTHTNCKKLVDNNSVDDLYLFGDCGEKLEYQYYTIKGNQIGDSFDIATSFKNGITIATKNNITNLYNKKIKKVSNDYTSIKNTDVIDYYIATDNNEKQYLINSKGKVIISGTEINIFKEKTNFGYMVTYKDANNMYNVYNIKKAKVLSTFAQIPELNKHYYTYIKSTKIYYYSYYDGSIFYMNNL